MACSREDQPADIHTKMLLKVSLRSNKELHKMLYEEDQLANAHLLVFANKQDLPHSMSAAERTDG